MSDDNVIEFPTRKPTIGEPPLKNLWVVGVGAKVDPKCTSWMHHFLDPDKPCVCGRETWNE